MSVQDEEPQRDAAYYVREWGISLPFDTTADWTHHQEIRQLFEEAAAKRRSAKLPTGDYQFFIAAFGARRRKAARISFLAFLKDVSTCPEEVLDMVRHYINPQRNVP